MMARRIHINFGGGKGRFYGTTNDIRKDESLSPETRHHLAELVKAVQRKMAKEGAANSANNPEGKDGD